jgi:hypothetical protein
MMYASAVMLNWKHARYCIRQGLYRRMPVHACKQLLLQLVKGECLIKFKTDPVDPFYAPYWEGRARFFEFQVDTLRWEARFP